MKPAMSVKMPPTAKGPCNVSAAKSTNRFGELILTRRGWTEGKGIGKNLDGIPQPLPLLAGQHGRGSSLNHIVFQLHEKWLHAPAVDNTNGTAATTATVTTPTTVNAPLTLGVTTTTTTTVNAASNNDTSAKDVPGALPVKKVVVKKKRKLIKPLWKCVPPPDDYTPHPSAEEILAKQLISGEKFDPDETPAEKKEREKTRLARKRLQAFSQSQKSVAAVTADREENQNTKQQTLSVNISEKSRKRILLKRNFPSKVDTNSKKDEVQTVNETVKSGDDANNEVAKDHKLNEEGPCENSGTAEDSNKNMKAESVLNFAVRLSEIRAKVPKTIFVKSEVFHPAKLNDHLLQITCNNVSTPSKDTPQVGAGGDSKESSAGEPTVAEEKSKEAEESTPAGDEGQDEEKEDVQTEEEYQAALKKFYDDLHGELCKEHDLGNPAELKPVEDGFIAVLKRDLKTTLPWPEDMIKKTTAEPSVTYSVNPLKFDFGIKSESNIDGVSGKKHKKKRSKKKKKKKNKKRKKKDKSKTTEKKEEDAAAAKTDKTPQKDGETSETKKDGSERKRKHSSSHRGGGSSDEERSSKKHNDHSDHSDYDRGRSRHRSGHSRSPSRSSDRGSRYSKRRRSRSWSDHYRRSSHRSRSYSRSPRYSRSRTRSYTRSRSRSYSRRSYTRSRSRTRYRSRTRSRTRTPSRTRTYTRPKVKPTVIKSAAKSEPANPGKRMKEWVRKALKESKATDPSLKSTKVTVPVVPKPKEKITELIQTLQNRKDATQETLGEGKGVVLTQSDTGKTHITGKTVVELDKPKVNNTNMVISNSPDNGENSNKSEEDGGDTKSDMMKMDPAELEKYRDLQESARRHVQQQMMQEQGIVPEDPGETSDMEISNYGQEQALTQEQSFQMVQSYMAAAAGVTPTDGGDANRSRGFIGPIHPGMRNELTGQSPVMVTPQTSLAEQLGLSGMIPGQAVFQVPRAGTPATHLVRVPPMAAHMAQMAQMGLLQMPQTLDGRASVAPSQSPDPASSPTALLRLASPANGSAGLISVPGGSQLMQIPSSVAMAQQAAAAAAAAASPMLLRLPNGMIVQVGPRPVSAPTSVQASLAASQPRLVRLPGGGIAVVQPAGPRMPSAASLMPGLTHGPTPGLTQGMTLMRQAVPMGAAGAPMMPRVAGMQFIPGMTVPGMQGLARLPGVASIPGMVPGMASMPASYMPGASAIPGLPAGFRFVSPHLVPRMSSPVPWRPRIQMVSAPHAMRPPMPGLSPAVASLLGKPLIKSGEPRAPTPQ